MNFQSRLQDFNFEWKLLGKWYKQNIAGNFQDLEEGNSDRHQKYRELKKREETMDTFMATYEENLKKEQEKIDQLERDIVFSLEHSSSNIDLDLSEIDSLKQKEGYTSQYDDGKKSVDILMKDYERFQGNLKKVRSYCSAKSSRNFWNLKRSMIKSH